MWTGYKAELSARMARRCMIRPARSRTDRVVASKAVTTEPRSTAARSTQISHPDCVGTGSTSLCLMWRHATSYGDTRYIGTYVGDGRGIR